MQMTLYFVIVESDCKYYAKCVLGLSDEAEQPLNIDDTVNKITILFIQSVGEIFGHLTTRKKRQRKRSSIENSVYKPDVLST